MMIRYTCPLCKREISEEIDENFIHRFVQELVACKRCCAISPKAKEFESQAYARKEREHIMKGGRMPLKFQDILIKQGLIKKSNA